MNIIPIFQVCQTLADHARYCFMKKCNNNIYKDTDILHDSYGNIGENEHPQKQENIGKPASGILENNELSSLRQSDDHSEVFSAFEPEIRNMLRGYFDSLLNFIYTFDI